MGSAFGAAGQRCLAGSVLRRGRRPRGRTGARGAGRRGRGDWGRRRATRTEVCPLVGPEARERVADAVERAPRRRNEVVLDGRRDAGPGGTLIGPDDRHRGPRLGPGPRGALRPAPGRRRAPTTSTARSSSPTARATATPARSSPPPGRPRAATARARRPGCWASTSASRRRSPGSRSRAGRTRSTATCTPTARTRSSSTPARRSSRRW